MTSPFQTVWSAPQPTLGWWPVNDVAISLVAIREQISILCQLQLLHVGALIVAEVETSTAVLNFHPARPGVTESITDTVSPVLNFNSAKTGVSLPVTASVSVALTKNPKIAKPQVIQVAVNRATTY